MNALAKGIVAVLSLTILTVMVVRCYGIFQGLPFSDVSDEVWGVSTTLMMASAKSVKPNIDNGYTSLFNYALVILYGLMFITGKMIGQFRDQYDFALLFMVNPWIFYFSARALSFCSGIGAVWFAWRSGRLVTGSPVGGAVAAAVLGLSVVHTNLSMIGKVDAMMVFFVACYMYQVLKVQKEGASVPAIAAAGVCFGLAIASKLNAALLAPALPLALMLQQGPALFCREWRKNLTYTSIYLGIAAASFLVANPAYLVAFKETVRLASTETSATRYVLFTGDGVPVRWLWIGKDLLLNERIVGILIIFSFAVCMVLALRTRRRELVLSLTCILIYVAYVGSWSKASLHYLLPVYPFFALITGVAIAELVAAEGKRRIIGAGTGTVMILLLAVLGLYRDCQIVADKAKVSTRTAAKRWMETNIPRNELIAYDDFSAGPPFFSPDIYLKTGAATQYEKFVPEALKWKMKEYAATHHSFRSIRLRTYLEKPLLPDAWSEEARRKYENDPLMIHHYKLVFSSPEELSGKNVGYIIVSEGYYDQFTGITYTQDNPLYEFNMRGRKFYADLFAGRYYLKVAEFKAADTMSGPRITIFKKKTEQI